MKYNIYEYIQGDGDKEVNELFPSFPSSYESFEEAKVAMVMYAYPFDKETAERYAQIELANYKANHVIDLSMSEFPVLMSIKIEE